MSQPLNPSVQPTDVYGGDEIAALVLDPGYCYTRAGFAGEDVPKSVLPSTYGHVGSRNPPLELFGEDYMMPRPDIEVRNYMSRDSVVEDWEVAARLWENMLVRSLHAAPQTPASRNGLNDDVKDDAKNGKRDGEGDIAMNDDDYDDDGDGVANTTTNNITKKPLGDVADTHEKSLQENPLLMSEAPWNSPRAREKAIEVIMENWGCPAFWMSRTPVLAAFAAGKATALVIDVGGANTSVTAIHDGMVLKKSIQRSPVGGVWLSSQIRTMFASSTPPVDIVPAFMVESKSAVEAGAPASAKLRTFGFPISDSFRALHEERTLLQFKESVVEVWHHRGRFLDPGNEDIVRSQPGPVFEFPNGANQMWHEQRYRVAEGMFDDAAQLATTTTTTSSSSSSSIATPDEPAITAPQTIPELVRAAISAVDVDVRGNLLANVVVTGGTSLVRGFTERLNMELQSMYPSLKIRTVAAGLTTERRFGAWVGGSILSSLGTFHQMWISRKEYEENGAGIVEKRCK